MDVEAVLDKLIQLKGNESVRVPIEPEPDDTAESLVSRILAFLETAPVEERLKLGQFMLGFGVRLGEISTPAAAAEAEPMVFTAHDVRAIARVGEKNEMWWRFGWNAILSGEPASADVTVEFLDADGIAIDTERHYRQAVPGELSGATLVRMPGAAQVAGLRVKVEPRGVTVKPDDSAPPAPVVSEEHAEYLRELEAEMREAQG